ncbi:putative transcriptional regulatory protein [Wickerhamomyces ciferrii]|uniref:Transcriptional regulatory protein n=1 Tax=Wickerhamomyces ciferrii (strain ATCC 14091 / BCRC 22168 / CBS 111 / JCM 3599 / NBRC 0793 / NRRL Y-1031 F-60-10) TaxID=1206466 RepID=K0KG72_WICCF|nr:putative transcriptional regulatory protein [Wickerhamomyces ciferrii]CCH41187.1 putative transcriptional regulatory protein [Wickerhamomyces ciferrii]
MMNFIDNSIACTGCRMRRKKCDKGKPICSGCIALDVPKELCIYPEERTQYRGKQPREYIKGLRNQNKILLKEQLIHKHKFQDCFLKNFQFENYVHLPVQNKSNVDFILRDPEQDESINWGHAGMLSYHALLQSEPLIYKANNKLNQFIQMEKIHYFQNKPKSEIDIQYNTKLNSIRNKVTEMCLGLKEVDESVLYEVLYAAADFLPNYTTVKSLFMKYFEYNSQRALGFDEEKAFQDFNSLFKQGPQGELELILKPTDSVAIYYNKLAITLVIISYPILFQYYSLPNTKITINEITTELKNYNPISLFAYIEILVFTASCFQNPKHEKILCTPTILQAISQIRYFEFYFPHGKADEEDTSFNSSLVAKIECTFLKSMELNKNIDQVFSMLPSPTIDNLKTLYLYMLIVDLRESFDLGLPSKFKYKELIKYQFNNPERTNLMNCLIMCFRVVERFHKFETLFTLENPCDTIEMDFIYELQVILQIEFPKLSELIIEFQKLDLLTLTASDLLTFTNKFQMIFCIYTMIITLYSICIRKTNQFDHGNHASLNKYKILSLKYSFLLNHATVEILKTFQRIINSKKCESLDPIEPFIRFSNYLRFSMKRTGVIIIARMFEFSPFTEDDVLSKIDQDYSWFNKLNFNQIEILQKATTGPHFKIEDLEDIRIDRTPDELFMKFKYFLDYKYLTLSVFKIMNEIGESLINTRYDLQYIIQNNYIYSRMCKLTIFLINMMGFNNELWVTSSTKSDNGLYKYTPINQNDESKYEFYIPELIHDSSWGRKSYDEWFGNEK